MSISTFRDRIQPALVEFAWSQWAQMGVLSRADRSDGWAQDPEALLVFTLRVGRRDPRLFDEVLDWLRRNGRLVIGRRLATLCPPGDADHPVVSAAVDWAREHGSPLCLGGRPLVEVAETPLFPTMHVAKADTVVLAHGYLKPTTNPSLNSADPDLSASMEASEARALMRHLDPILTAAGVAISHEGSGAEYWPTFEENVARLLGKLGA